MLEFLSAKAHRRLYLLLAELPGGCCVFSWLTDLWNRRKPSHLNIYTSHFWELKNPWMTKFLLRQSSGPGAGQKEKIKPWSSGHEGRNILLCKGTLGCDTAVFNGSLHRYKQALCCVLLWFESWSSFWRITSLVTGGNGLLWARLLLCSGDCFICFES